MKKSTTFAAIWLSLIIGILCIFHDLPRAQPLLLRDGSGIPCTSGIGFVNALDGGFTSGVSSFSTVYTTSMNCNRLLVVEVIGDTVSDLITGATYAGVSMTLVGKQLVPTERWQYFFYLVAPAPGANNIVATSSSNTFFQILTTEYKGVNQATPTDGSNAINNVNGGTSLTTSVTTTIANDWTIMIEQGFDSSNPPAAGAGSVLRVVDTACCGEGGMFDSGGPIVSPGLYSMTTTRPTAAGIGHVMQAFRPQ